MKMPWSKLFGGRRKSVSETELREDYPTDTDDDITDDERRREQWRRHIGAPPGGGLLSHVEEEKWDYVSESNLSFSSDNSIIDAFSHHRKYPDERDFDDIYKQAEQEVTNSNGRKRETQKSKTLCPLKTDGRHRHRSEDSARHRESPNSPATSIREKVKAFEQAAAGKRRASCQQGMAVEKNKDDYTRGFSTWNTNTGNNKRRNRKPTKQRRRAYDNNPEYSEDESKYTVNLSMHELNDIIKKNVTSAMKTITTTTILGQNNGIVPISPSESFSTETETMFSGSSSHSTELPPGILNKQIKAQLDKDWLRGRRLSLVPVPTSDIEAAMTDRRASTVAAFNPNQLHPNAFANTQQQPQQHIQQQQQQPQHMHQLQQPQQLPQQQQQQTDIQMSPYLTMHNTATSIPPPPPPPPPPPLPSHIPQVTFNLPNLGMDSTRHRGSYDQDLPTVAGLSPTAFNRLQVRRHSVASLGHEEIIAGLCNNFESKLEKVSKAIQMIENNDNPSRRESKDKDVEDTKKTNATRRDSRPSVSGPSSSTRTDPIAVATANALGPVLSIADQIKALSAKPKKVLKPGQIAMAGWARCLLIFTNIVFLMAGCGLVGLGVWMMMDPLIETYFAILNVDQDGTDFKIICYALIGIGALITFISTTGCCGGIRSSKCLLTMFIVLVGVITLAQAGLGAMVMLNLDNPSAIPIVSAIFEQVEGNLMSTLKRSLVEKYAPETLIGTTWDSIQIDLECCGASGPDDYQTSAWKNDTTNELTIPDTCCKLVSKTDEVPEPSNKLLCQMGTTGFFHAEGCYGMMVGWFKGNSKYIVAGGVTTLCIEVFSFIFALIICRKAVREDKKKKSQPGHR